MSTRIRLGAAGAVAALAALIVALSAPQAVATQGQPVIAGQNNTATAETWIWNTALTNGCGFAGSYALVVCGGTYSEAAGTGVGVIGAGRAFGGTGVRGDGPDGGTGVKGSNAGTTGIGVHGQTGGTGSGVYGQATGTGVGVYGDTVNGTGVVARSTNGTALSVAGKATFSRSGTIVVPAGTSARTVTLAGVTTASMVLATSQQNAAVFVKSAVPASGSFTIRLSGTAPAGGVKVAYFVLN